MAPLSSFDLILAVENQGKVKQERRMLTSEANDLVWSKDGKTVQFRLELVNEALNHVIFNFPWQTKTPLRSRKGVHLMPYSKIKTTVKRI